ncbi:Gfo/Idh/MocA family oxidoreductase [candidate division KSB1 bacterium]|nr:Gfo/Idh/MocA family oxidoreductase [candidate division KSB1 bacterium]
MEENKKDFISAAIIGCGNIASGLDDDVKKRHIYSHAKAISFVKAIRLVACCDIDESRLLDFSEKWHVPRAYITLEKMLGEEKIDILIIATPAKCHHDNLLTALTSEVEVIFCEKPFVLDFELGMKIVKNERERDKLITVNYMRRWDKFYAECKRILETGQLGRIETIVGYVDTALYMNSIHMLDMLAYFGGDVLSCTGYLDKTSEPRIVHGKPDVGGIALFRHKNGVTSFFKGTGESRRNHFFELDIQCTKGRMRILNDDEKYEIYRFDESPQHTGLVELKLTETKYNADQDERVVNVYREIVDYLKTGRLPSYTAKDALKSLEMVNMIYESDALDHQLIFSRL